MKIDFHQPKNETLAKYIEGYYFISENKNAQEITYWTFPNNFCILTCNQNIDVEIENDKVFIQTSNIDNIITSIVSRYSKPIQINYKELVNEVTIYFKPLGINYFLSDTAQIFSNNINVDISLFTDFNDKMMGIFSLKIEEKIEELENYLISKFQEKDLKLIENILLSIETDKKIEDIAKENLITRQYLNKIFKKHIGKSLSEYRKIHRFRKSIFHQKDSKNFTELSHYNFYDQSHFTRTFKDLTEIKPNTFFKNIDTEKRNIWLFI